MENRLTGYFMYLHMPPKQEDIDALAKNIEAATTYEWAEDILQQLPPPPTGAGFTFIDRTLWLLRWAYIFGYRAGIYAENNMAAIREEQDKRIESLVCQKILREGKGKEVLAILEEVPRVKHYKDLPFSVACEVEAALNQLGRR